MASDFISEDDLNTFDGYLRLQAVDPSTAGPDVLAMYRQFFDEAMAIRATTPKLGAMKFKPVAGECRYAVAVRACVNMAGSQIAPTVFGPCPACMPRCSQPRSEGPRACLFWPASMLRSKLYELELEKKKEITKKQEDSKLDSDFGSQIRSYVLQPYRIVKDHRTKVEIGDVDRVLDGDLQPLIRGYLLARRNEKNS